MMLPRLLAAIGAAVLLPLTAGIPAAHADESFSGTIDGSDATKIFTQPNVATDQCNPAGSPTPDPAPYDAVQYVSQSNGPRRIVMTGTAEGTPTVEPFAIYAYRNGTCVAADYANDPSENAEIEAGVLDLDNVMFAVGDTVRIEVISFYTPATWTISVLQPGTANAVSTGNGAKYAGLSYQIDCVAHTTPVAFTKKFAKKIDDVRWVKVKANGATVKKLKGKKLAKVAKKAKKGKPYVVAGVPAGTMQLTVQIKLDNGKKKTLSRAYSSC